MEVRSVDNVFDNQLLSSLKKFTNVKPYKSDDDFKEGALLAFDFENSDVVLKKEQLELAKKHKSHLLLLNTNDKAMAKLFMIGFKAEAVLITMHENYNVIHPVSSPTFVQGKKSSVEQKDGNIVSSPVEEAMDLEIPKKGANDIASLIKNQVEPEELNKLTNYIDGFGSKSSLPKGYSYHTYIADTRHGILPGTTSAYNNAVLFKVELFASYTPKAKYLNIQCLGAGFSPALEKNLSSWRGFWQNRVDIVMQPVNGDLSILTTKPNNVNNQTTYSDSSSIGIGIDVSANPGFSANYTIENTVTNTISDFCVEEATAGKRAEWGFQMEMTKTSRWNVFNGSTVKNLPALATRNLKTHCEATWIMQEPYTSSVKFSLNFNVLYLNAYSRGNMNYWQSQTVGCGFYPGNATIIDFDHVHAD